MRNFPSLKSPTLHLILSPLPHESETSLIFKFRVASCHTIASQPAAFSGGCVLLPDAYLLFICAFGWGGDLFLFIAVIVQMLHCTNFTCRRFRVWPQEVCSNISFISSSSGNEFIKLLIVSKGLNISSILKNVLSNSQKMLSGLFLLAWFLMRNLL